MAASGNFLIQLGNILSWLINLYCWVVVARILLSWFHPNPQAPVTRFLVRATEPALELTRRLVPLRLGGLDFSPVILLIALNILRFLVRTCLYYLSTGAPAVGLLGLLALGLIQAIMMLTWFFLFIMAARVVISLVNPSPYNPLVMAVMALTEPLVEPLRGKIPARGPGGIDTRALILVVALYIFQAVVLNNLGGPVETWVAKLMATSNATRIMEPRIY
ncbi:MAG: YggT family protein [Deltaproteobacteria bacterium]|nr:YggT family protein [Deltaproteobacteria bacterium]